MNILLLKQEISKRGVSVRDISKALGIDVSTYYRKLNREKTFSVEEAQIITNVLKLTKQRAIQIFLN